jgi:cell division protein FtsW
VLKILVRAKSEPDPFAALALSGLAMIFGFQAVINMGVNTALLPAKGMTLPFISYGGSSLLGMAFGMGLVLALGRRRFGAKSHLRPLQPAYA